MAELPHDRSHITTEQRHADIQREGLDTRKTRDVIALVAKAQAAGCLTVAAQCVPIEAFVDDVVAGLHRGGRLIYLGAGTSGRLGVLDASECPPTFGSNPNTVIGLIAGGDSALRVSSEGAEDDCNGAAAQLKAIGLGDADTVLGIAAGGTTPWVIGGLAIAKANGATTGLLSCALCTRPDGCDHLIQLDTGAELLTGSTRLAAGAATKAALNAISTAVFVKRGAVYGDLMVDLKVTNAKLLDRAIRILRLFQPSLDRAQGAASIEAAGGSLKVAIVCCRGSIDASTAQLQLHEANGNLRQVLNAFS
jgi:N-acetylmuramic acid 6-phosphate etherase